MLLGNSYLFHLCDLHAAGIILSYVSLDDGSLAAVAASSLLFIDMTLVKIKRILICTSSHLLPSARCYVHFYLISLLN